MTIDDNDGRTSAVDRRSSGISGVLSMATMHETAHAILAELDDVLGRVDEAQVTALCDALIGARRVSCHGLGREGLALRSFAMRLMHIGFNVAMVGDVTAPPVGAGDLFLLSCGPGRLATSEALAALARRDGAQVAVITAQPAAPLPRQADLVLTLPAQTMADDRGGAGGSRQAMGSAFEQAMWILFDALVPRLQEARGQSLDDLRRRHQNLE
jgi:6-phospho-3-hexuloisomerase